MCRLFGHFAFSSQNSADCLDGKEFSILNQSFRRRKHLQKDGWGVAYLETSPARWRLEKSRGAVYRERRRFGRVARRAASKLLLAHIRQASNPRKLLPEKLIRMENVQSFVFGKPLLAHNGTLHIPDEVARTLGDWKKKIRGTNDSEVLFWLFVKSWRGRSSQGSGTRKYKRVFEGMIRHIQKVWRAIPKKERRHSVPHRGLNFLASDGRTLAALSYYDRPDGRSLCGQNRPYFELCFRRLDGKWVVASEPLDRTRGWRRIPNRRGLVFAPKLEPLFFKVRV